MKRFKRPISEVAKGFFHQGSGDSKPVIPNLGVNSKKAEGDSPLNMNSPAKRGGGSSTSSDGTSSGGRGGGGGHMRWGDAGGTSMPYLGDTISWWRRNRSC